MIPTPHFDSVSGQTLFWLLIVLGTLLFGWMTFLFGRLVGRLGTDRKLASRESELFTAQKGFRKLYESDITDLRARNEQLEAEVLKLRDKVEEYRKKAAGFGGLFSSSGKRADAMYALLLENEALEQALYQQNSKLQETQGETVKEAIRQAGYRRVLLGQLMADDRIKGVVSEILGDERRLPASAEVSRQIEGRNGA